MNVAPKLKWSNQMDSRQINLKLTVTEVSGCKETGNGVPRTLVDFLPRVEMSRDRFMELASRVASSGFIGIDQSENLFL